MREEIWDNLLFATLNAEYFKRRAQRAHRISWWLAIVSTAFGAGSIVGLAARNLPDWLWPAFAVTAAVLVIANNQLSKDDEKGLCARAAVEWSQVAEGWHSLWRLARDDLDYIPPAEELKRLHDLTADAKKIAPHLPESKRLRAEAWATSLQLHGAQ